MALAVDATSHGYESANSSGTLTIPHTCAAGATLLAVMVAMVDGFSNTVSVTYNGVSMTKRKAATAGQSVAIFTLANPDSGTHNIVQSVASASRRGVAGISFVNNVGDIGASGESTGSTTTATQTTATTGTTGFVLGALAWDDPTTLAYTGSGTAIETAVQAGQFGRSFIYEAFAASANPTETWTQATAARTWTTVYLEIDEGAAASTFKPISTVF